MEMMTASFEIDNTYENGDKVRTYAMDVELPVPPGDEDSDGYYEWSWQHVHPLTGTGRAQGDAWYDVLITKCSVPELVGREFDFGY